MAVEVMVERERTVVESEVLVVTEETVGMLRL